MMKLFFYRRLCDFNDHIKRFVNVFTPSYDDTVLPRVFTGAQGKRVVPFLEDEVIYVATPNEHTFIERCSAKCPPMEVIE